MSDSVKNVLEWVYCIVIALVLALLFRYFIATPTVVKQRSMFPTLKEGQRLVLNRTARITNKPLQVGDVVTFEAPTTKKSLYTKETADQSNPVAVYDEVHGFLNRFFYYTLEITKTSYIKRVIATEGQHVVIKDNQVIINGEVLDESAYLGSDVVTESTVFNDFIVPEGYLFCMGDNRQKSTDCRKFGCVPFDKLEGIVTCRFWPLDKIGSIK